MRIVIVAPYCSIPGEGVFNRFLALAEIFSKNNQVILVTSRFRHFDKTFRIDSLNMPNNYDVVLIDELGYKKNVSVSRILSHKVFIHKFSEWFENYAGSNRVDCVYSAYPLIGTNTYLSKMKNKFGYKYVVDIQDLWPDAFSVIFPPLKNLPRIFMPYGRASDQVFKSADILVSVAKKFLLRASQLNSSAQCITVYIGADSRKLEEIKPLLMNPKQIHFCYLGTIGSSYDISTLIGAFRKFSQLELPYKLHVVGDGPNRIKLTHDAIGLDNVVFYGPRSYDFAISVAKGSNVLINPIVKSSFASVTNKLSDYLLLGKPILNSQEDEEVSELLQGCTVVHYTAGDVDDFSRAVSVIVNQTHDSSFKNFLDLVDRSVSYPKLVNQVLSFLQGESV